MAITAAELKFYHSGGSSNSDPNASLGGVISSSELSGSVHNLFDVVGSSEASSGDIEYRCFYAKNTNATLTLQSAVFWISTDATGATTDIAVGLDPAGVSGTATTIGGEGSAPAGVSFSTPTSEGAALSIGDMAAGAYQAIWVRRTVNAGATAANGLSATFTLKGDTAA